MRTPVVPGFNDTAGEIKAISAFAASLPGVEEHHLLPYHRLWQDKYMLWSDILIWIGTCGDSDKDIISQNTWIFSKEVYLNEFGTLKKCKAFYKKCIEIASTEQHKAYFEKQYNKCE